MRSLVLAYLTEGGSRSRLLALVDDECKAAGLTQAGTAKMLAYWARAVDAADPGGPTVSSPTHLRAWRPRTAAAETSGIVK